MATPQRRVLPYHLPCTLVRILNEEQSEVSIFKKKFKYLLVLIFLHQCSTDMYFKNVIIILPQGSYLNKLICVEISRTKA